MAFLHFPSARKLAYDIFGDTSLRRPVFYFHGTPGSRQEAILGADIAKELGISLIAFDRPGIGDSTFDPKRDILDVTHDVVSLADHLGLKRFGILGVSGGGPYAAACAHTLKDRIIHVALVSSLAPFDVCGSNALLRVAQSMQFLGTRSKTLGRVLTHMLTSRVGSSAREFFLKKLRKKSPQSDPLLLNQPHILELLERNYNLVKRRQDGFAHEVNLLVNPWGFALESIEVPVDIWHGTADQTVPLSMAKYLARTIPQSKSHFIPEHGHFIIIDHLKQILQSLALATHLH